MKKKILSLCLLLCSAFSADLTAQQDTLNIQLADEAAIILGGQTYTIGDAVRTAIERNSDVLSGKYDLAMAFSDYESYDAKYSPWLQGSIGASSKKYQPLLQEENGDSQKSVNGAFSAGKSFSTGTGLFAGLTHSWTDTHFPGPDASSAEKGSYKYNTPCIYAGLEQELLKNCFGYNDRRTKDILKKSAEIRKEQTVYGLSQIVVGVILQYWQVMLARTELDNANLMLQETKKVRSIIAENVRLGITEQYQLNYWNSILTGSEASSAMALQTYRDSLRNLLRILNIDDIDVDSEIKGKTSTILSGRKIEVNMDEALETAYKYRVDYQSAVKGMEIADLQYEIAANSALPSLKGSVKASTTDSNEKAGTAYSHSASLKYPSIEGQLAMTYVLDDKDQKIQQRNARWQKEQAKITLTKAKRAVKDDIASRAEGLDTTYSLYQKSKEQRIQSEIYYSKILTNLRQGRFSATTVREALSNLVSSRNQELEFLINYNASVLQFQVAQNTLFKNYGIDIDSYIPKETE